MRMMEVRFRLLYAALGVAVLGLPCAPARAQPGDDALARGAHAARPDDRVRTAVARGVALLARVQGDDGSFPEPRWGAGVLHLPARATHVESTSVAALALAHAGTERSEELADRAIDYLIRDDARPRFELLYRVAPASLTVLALLARDRHPSARAELTARVRGALREHGHWPFAMNTGTNGRPAPAASHLAALALAGVERAGGTSWEPVWSARAEALAARAPHLFRDAGDVSRDGALEVDTCLGIADFAICRARGRLREGVGVLRHVRIDRTEALLGSRAENVLETVRGEASAAFATPRRATARSLLRATSLFDLFAVSTAATFHDRSRVGTLDWYAAGREYLLARQNPDGGWGPAGGLLVETVRSDAAETAWALLFLTRAARALHPRRGAVVGGGTDAVAPPTAAPPTVDAALAWGSLEELEQLLADGATSPEFLRAALDDLRFTYDRLRDVDDERSRAWRRGAELLLLRAVAAPPRRPSAARRPAPGGDPASALPFQAVAASALGDTHPRVSEELCQVVDRTYFGDGARSAPRGLLLETFAALARLGRPESAAWMIRRGLTAAPGPQAERLAREALQAISEWRDLPASQRVVLAWGLLRHFDTAERPPGPAAPEPAPGWPYALRPALLRALRHLCADPVDGTIPDLDRWTCTLEELAGWLGENDDPAEPPWTPLGR